MRKLITLVLALLVFISYAMLLSGCESNPVTNIIIANEKYNDKASIEKAIQPTELSKTSDAYASIYFIESPKGMKYTAIWYYDGEAVKTEEKKMTADKHGPIVYMLEADKMKSGTLKFEVRYKDTIVIQKEITTK